MVKLSQQKINIVKRSVYKWCNAKSLNFPYATKNAVKRSMYRWSKRKNLKLPMSSTSNGTFFSYKNKVEGEVMIQDPQKKTP